MAKDFVLNEKHRLDPARIIKTAENLAQRVKDSLPGSGLADLAVELAGIAHATNEHARQIRRPIYAIRAASWLAVSASLLGLWYLVTHIRTRWDFMTISELFAGTNLLILLAGALWFLINIEERVKRKKALAFIGELREFIHVIDVTQLYHTPELYKANPAASRTPLNHTYFLFCTEMLAVISNLAPLYARGVSGDSIWRATSEVEMLANAIAVKLVSKAESIRTVSAMD
jgi:hypothetical protein